MTTVFFGNHLGGETVFLRSSLTGREIELNVSLDRFAVPDVVAMDRLSRAREAFAAHVVALVDEVVRSGRKPSQAPYDLGLPPTIRAMLDAVMSASDDVEFRIALDGLLSQTSLMQRATSRVFGTPRAGMRIVEALVLLWRHGLLLFPTGFIWIMDACEWLRVLPPFEETWYGPTVGVLRRFSMRGYNRSQYILARRTLMSIVLASRGVNSVGDIDATLISTVWCLRPEGLPSQRLRTAYSFADRLRDEQAADYSGDASRLQLIPRSYRPDREILNRSDPSFRWATKRGARLGPWVELCQTYVASLTRRTSMFVDVLTMSMLLDFVVGNEGVSAEPLDVCRIGNEHRESLLSFLSAWGNASSRNKNRRMKVVMDAFAYLLATKASDANGDTLPGFRNPIAERDFDPEARRPGQTERRPIPQKFVRMICEILDEEDQLSEIGEVVKPAWVRTLEADYFLKGDGENGVRRIWSPVRRDLIRLRMEVPIRTFQARVLDSGEGDAEVFRPERGGWVANDGPWRPSAADRRPPQGLVRRMFDAELGQHFNGLFITTNKTQDRSAADADDYGYEVPWENPVVLALFCRLRDWQERHNPLARPMTRAEIKDQKNHTSADVAARLPKLHFLFRDAASKFSRDEPVSDSRLTSFWCLLVEELQRRLAERGVRNPDGSPITLVTSRDAISGLPKSVEFDLHSIRVTGLTALANVGVPLHILSAFVAGHATFVMTLYYQRPSSGHVTRVLNDAATLVTASEEADWIDYLGRGPEAAPAVAATNDPIALRDAAGYQPGLWSRSGIGLCPNAATKCSVGGELRRKNLANGDVHDPVPEGPLNCPLCRFFVTGPIYLGGLVAQLNQTSGEIREVMLSTSGREADRRRAMKERDAAVAHDPERGRRLDVKVNQLDEAIEKLQANLETLSRRWAAVLRLILRCQQILNGRAGGEPGAAALGALVLNGTADDLKVGFSACSDFELWDSICRSSEFYPRVEAKVPALRRGKLYDAVFGRHGIRPLFVTLSEGEAVAVGNEFGRFLTDRVGGEGLHALLNGSSSLDQLNIRREVMAWVDGALPEAERIEAPRLHLATQDLLPATADHGNREAAE